MKKLSLFIWVLFFGMLVLMSCNSGTTSEEVENLKIQNERLKNITDKRDSTINELISAFNEIQENFATIKEKQNLITINSKGNIESGDSRDMINRDIQAINDLMNQNRRTIASLNQKIKNSDLKLSEFQKLLENTNQQIKEKDKEITALKDELVNLNFAIDILNATVDTLQMVGQEKDAVIDLQQEQLNTAWFVFGTDKELKENGVITKQGGFIGIGGIQKLMQDFNKDYFTKININDVKSIPLMASKARLITSHPSGSFTFKQVNGKIDRLEITDPASFWRASKYLVILIE